MATGASVQDTTLSPRLKWIPLGLYLLAIFVVLWSPSSSVPGVGGYDKVGHILLFMGFTWLFWWAYPSTGWDRIAWACAAGFALGFVTELGQIFVAGRTYDWLDLVADWVGVLLALSPAMMRAWQATAKITKPG